MSNSSRINDSDDRTATPPISPVRIMVSPPMVPATPDSPILIPPIPIARSLSQFPELNTPPHGLEQEEYDLYCHEEFIEPPRRPKKKGLIEPVEEVVDRSISCLKGQILSLSVNWNECQVKHERMKREIQGLKRTIDHYEDKVDELEHQLVVERTCNGILQRTCHRLKKLCMENNPHEVEQECPICSRSLSDLLSVNLPLVMVGCCGNRMCLHCIVQLTHIQHSNQPSCPFCRECLC